MSNRSDPLRARYTETRRTAAPTVAKAKRETCKKFGDQMESDYRTVIKVFWQTIRRLRQGGQHTLRVVKDRNGEVLAASDVLR